MGDREDLARRILINREYSDEAHQAIQQQFCILTKVSFNQLDPPLCTENQCYKYVVFQIEGNRFLSLRGQCRVGMPPNPAFWRTYHNDLGEFEQMIVAEIRDRGLQRINVEYINANHLVYGQTVSFLSGPVVNLLTRLIDEYMPNGILNINEVLQAEDILRDIRQQLEANEHVDTNLSEQFYQIIPQNGNLYRLEVINDRRMYRNKIEYLDRLRSALEAIYAGVQHETNAIDYFAHYWLRTVFREVDRESEEFSQLDRCTRETQHPNHRFFRLSNAFGVTSSADIEFANNIPNQRLLYHFTFPCNILSILRNGLQAAPRHIYSQHRFFGDGIYFWDCASMALSAFNDLPNEMAPVLLVCRVALGAAEIHNAMFLEQGNVLQLQNGMNSVFSEGREFSNVTSETVNIRGTEMYCGQIAQLWGGPSFSNYNRYMVQSKHQVKIEYILQFERV